MSSILRKLALRCKQWSAQQCAAPPSGPLALQKVGGNNPSYKSSATTSSFSFLPSYAASTIQCLTVSTIALWTLTDTFTIPATTNIMEMHSQKKEQPTLLTSSSSSVKTHLQEWISKDALDHFLRDAAIQLTRDTTLCIQQLPHGAMIPTDTLTVLLQLLRRLALTSRRHHKRIFSGASLSSPSLPSASMGCDVVALERATLESFMYTFSIALTARVKSSSIMLWPTSSSLMAVSTITYTLECFPSPSHSLFVIYALSTSVNEKVQEESKGDSLPLDGRTIPAEVSSHHQHPPCHHTHDEAAHAMTAEERPLEGTLAPIQVSYFRASLALLQLADDILVTLYEVRLPQMGDEELLLFMEHLAAYRKQQRRWTPLYTPLPGSAATLTAPLVQDIPQPSSLRCVRPTPRTAIWEAACKRCHASSFLQRLSASTRHRLAQAVLLGDDYHGMASYPTPFFASLSRGHHPEIKEASQEKEGEAHMAVSCAPLRSIGSAKSGTNMSSPPGPQQQCLMRALVQLGAGGAPSNSIHHSDGVIAYPSLRARLSSVMLFQTDISFTALLPQLLQVSERLVQLFPSFALDRRHGGGAPSPTSRKEGTRPSQGLTSLLQHVMTRKTQHQTDGMLSNIAGSSSLPLPEITHSPRGTTPAVKADTKGVQIQGEEEDGAPLGEDQEHDAKEQEGEEGKGGEADASVSLWDTHSLPEEDDGASGTLPPGPRRGRPPSCSSSSGVDLFISPFSSLKTSSPHDEGKGRGEALPRGRLAATPSGGPHEAMTVTTFMGALQEAVVLLDRMKCVYFTPTKPGSSHKGEEGKKISIEEGFPMLLCYAATRPLFWEMVEDAAITATEKEKKEKEEQPSAQDGAPRKERDLSPSSSSTPPSQPTSSSPLSSTLTSLLVAWQPFLVEVLESNVLWLAQCETFLSPSSTPLPSRYFLLLSLLLGETWKELEKEESRAREVGLTKPPFTRHRTITIPGMGEHKQRQAEGKDPHQGRQAVPEEKGKKNRWQGIKDAYSAILRSFLQEEVSRHFSSSLTRFASLSSSSDFSSCHTVEDPKTKGARLWALMVGSFVLRALEPITVDTTTSSMATPTISVTQQLCHEVDLVCVTTLHAWALQAERHEVIPSLQVLRDSITRSWTTSMCAGHSEGTTRAVQEKKTIAKNTTSEMPSSAPPLPSGAPDPLLLPHPTTAEVAHAALEWMQMMSIYWPLIVHGVSSSSVRASSSSPLFMVAPGVLASFLRAPCLSRHLTPREMIESVLLLSLLQNKPWFRWAMTSSPGTSSEDAACISSRIPKVAHPLLPGKNEDPVGVDRDRHTALEKGRGEASSSSISSSTGTLSEVKNAFTEGTPDSSLSTTVSSSVFPLGISHYVAPFVPLYHHLLDLLTSDPCVEKHMGSLKKLLPSMVRVSVRRHRMRRSPLDQAPLGWLEDEEEGRPQFGSSFPLLLDFVSNGVGRGAAEGVPIGMHAWREIEKQLRTLSLSCWAPPLPFPFSSLVSTSMKTSLPPMWTPYPLTGSRSPPCVEREAPPEEGAEEETSVAVTAFAVPPGADVLKNDTRSLYPKEPSSPYLPDCILDMYVRWLSHSCQEIMTPYAVVERNSPPKTGSYPHRNRTSMRSAEQPASLPTAPTTTSWVESSYSVVLIPPADTTTLLTFLEERRGDAVALTRAFQILFTRRLGQRQPLLCSPTKRYPTLLLDERAREEKRRDEVKNTEDIDEQKTQGKLPCSAFTPAEGSGMPSRYAILQVSGLLLLLELLTPLYEVKELSYVSVAHTIFDLLMSPATLQQCHCIPDLIPLAAVLSEPLCVSLRCGRGLAACIQQRATALATLALSALEGKDSNTMESTSSTVLSMLGSRRGEKDMKASMKDASDPALWPPLRPSCAVSSVGLISGTGRERALLIAYFIRAELPVEEDMLRVFRELTCKEKKIPYSRR